MNKKRGLIAFILLLLILLLIYFFARPKNQEIEKKPETETESMKEAEKETATLTPKQEEVKKNVEGIRDKFIKMAEKEGFKLDFVPDVKLSNMPLAMSFMKGSGSEEKGYLAATDWDSIPDDKKELVNSWMKKAGSKWTGEDFFNKNFNWFGVPRELGRYMKRTQGVGNIKDGDYWSEELYANKTAVNFWLNQGKEKELQEFMGEVDKIVASTDSPTPDGKDDVEYFNTNYDELSKDMGKYSYYQFKLYKQAWDERGDAKTIIIKDMKSSAKGEEGKEQGSTITPEQEELKKKLEEMRDDFMQVAKDEGYEVGSVPEVVVSNSEQTNMFVNDPASQSSGSLVAKDWTSVPEEQKKIINSWMERTGSAWTGEDFFNKNVNWFGASRDLGRYIQSNQGLGGISEGDHWTKELNASKMAINFWINQVGESELQDFMYQVTMILESMDSPTPELEDDAQYFNANYYELVKDVEKYAYYQFMIYKKAWYERYCDDEVIINETK
ncbi:MAG: hypothetical protein CSB16_01445 [Clostridiales bacterium]|nr:MAG: hypothetical protein CSB16_01445 [Clostridiales bacterium]